MRLSVNLVFALLLALQTPVPQERLFIDAFLVQAHIGLDLDRVLPELATMGDPVIDNLGIYGEFERRYAYRFGSLVYDFVNGRVSSYAGNPRPSFRIYDPDRSIVPRAVSNEDAAAIAQRIYNAAGYPGSIRVEEVEDLSGNNDACVLVRYLPTLGGIPYGREYGDLIYLDRQTGRVHHFSAPTDLPLSPPTLNPAGTPVQARLLAMRAALDQGRSRRLTSVQAAEDGFELRVWLPHRNDVNRSDVLRFMPDPRLRAATLARQGILAYVGTVVYRPGLWVDMVIDARTGEVIQSRVMDLAVFGRGTGGGVPAPPAKPLVLPTALRPWRVAKGKAGWNAWSAPVEATLKPVKGNGPVPKGRIALSDGTSAFEVAYDGAKDVVWLVRPDRTPLAYRPAPALSKLLRRHERARVLPPTRRRTT